MSERQNITPLQISHFVVGWTYSEDGQWYAATSDDNRSTLGPFKQMGDASDALIKSTRLHSHSVGDGTYLLLVTSDNDGLLHDDAAGMVTWFTTDKTKGESIRWTVRDGKVDINAMSGVGTPLNAEAKGAAMLEAAQQAQAALAALEVTA